MATRKRKIPSRPFPRGVTRKIPSRPLRWREMTPAEREEWQRERRTP